jgi:hypothetical protein
MVNKIWHDSFQYEQNLPLYSINYVTKDTVPD